MISLSSVRLSVILAADSTDVLVTIASGTIAEDSIELALPATLSYL